MSTILRYYLKPIAETPEQNILFHSDPVTLLVDLVNHQVTDGEIYLENNPNYKIKWNLNKGNCELTEIEKIKNIKTEFNFDKTEFEKALHFAARYQLLKKLHLLQDSFINKLIDQSSLFTNQLMSGDKLRRLIDGTLEKIKNAFKVNIGAHRFKLFEAFAPPFKANDMQKALYDKLTQVKIENITNLAVVDQIMTGISLKQNPLKNTHIP